MFVIKSYENNLKYVYKEIAAKLAVDGFRRKKVQQDQFVHAYMGVLKKWKMTHTKVEWC